MLQPDSLLYDCTRPQAPSASTKVLRKQSGYGCHSREGGNPVWWALDYRR